MSEQLGLDIKIKIDKNASNKEIRDYMKDISQNENFQSAIKVGIDSKDFDKIAKQAAKLGKMSITTLPDGAVKTMKELILANGDILKITELIDAENNRIIENVTVQTNKTKQLADYYKNINKLIGDKLKLEKLIENSKGDDNRKAKTQLKAIESQISAQKELIEAHELYNKKSAEQLEVNRKIKMNEIEISKLQLKNASGAQREGYETILKSQEKEFRYRTQLLTASKEEAEVLQRKIEAEGKIQASTQKSLNGRGLTNDKLQDMLKLNKEILSDEVKAKDIVLQRKNAYSELMAIEDKIVQKEKQLIGADVNTSAEIETQLSNLRITSMEKELELKARGLASEEQELALENKRLQNAKELEIVQAKYIDKTSRQEDKQAETQFLERQKKIYDEMLSTQKEINKLSKQAEGTKVEEKRVELEQQINSLKKEQRDLEIKAWQKGLESSKLQEKVNKTRIKGEKEIAVLRAENTGKERSTQNDKETNALLKEQSQLYTNLKSVTKEIIALDVQRKTATGDNERLKAEEQYQLALEKEKKLLDEIHTKGMQDATQEATIRELKQVGANQLQMALAKQYDALSKIEEKEQAELARAETLIANSKKALQLDVERLKVSKDAQYLDNSGLVKVEQSIRELNGATTREVQDQIKKIKLELRELGSNATIARIKDTGNALDNMGESLKRLGVYVSGAMIISELWQAFKSGITYIKDLDEAFTDVAVSMDISREKFNTWTKDARKIAQANGLTTTSLMEMVKIYATAGEEIEDIQEKLEGTAMIQNITQWDAEQTTSAVNSIISQYKLLDKEIKGTTGNYANAIEYMGDALVGISNELKVDNVAGIQEMVSAIDVAGAVMEQSGASMEWYMATAGTLKESMNVTGSEVGNAMKMMTARMFAQAQAMEELGESAENVEIEVRKAEKALNEVDISIRDANNPAKLRDMQDIMDELADKWKGLEDSTKKFVAEGVAGTNRSSYFVNIMENYERIEELTKAGEQSTGALAKANESRVESLEAQINILTDKMLSFMDGFEPMISGSVQLGIAILDLVDNIGALPSAIGLVTSYMLLFKKEGRELTQTLLGLSTRYSVWVQNIEASKVALSAVIAQKRTDIAVTKASILGHQMMGASTTGLIAKLFGLKASLLATQVQMVATTVAVGAFQAVASVGMSVAITAVISLLGKLVSSMFNAKNGVDELNESFSKLKTDTDSLEQSVASLESLTSKYETLNEAMQNTAVGSEEYKNMEEELLDIQRQLAQNYPLLTSYIDTEGNAYATNLDSVKKYTEAQKELLQTQKDAMLSTATVNKPILEANLKNLEDTRENLNQELEDVQAMITDLDSKAKSTSNPVFKAMYEYDLGLAQQKHEELSGKIVETNQAITETSETLISYGTILDQASEAAEKNADANDKLSDSYDEAGNVIEETKTKLSEMHSMLNDTDSAQQQFVDLGNKMEDVYGILDSINEEGLNFDNMAKVQSAFEDFTGNITDAAEVQQFLNDKIAEMEEAQEIAYFKMIQSTEEWQDFVIGVNENMAEVNAKMLTVMGDNYEEYFGDIANAYEIDLSNCKNLAEARIQIEAEAAEKIAKMRQALIDAFIDEQAELDKQLRASGIDGLTGAAPSPFAGQKGQAYRDAVAEINAWKNSALEAIDAVANITKPTFENLQSPSSKDKDKDKDSDKTVEDLEDVANAYYEIENALKDVNNALDLNNAKQENAKGKERVELMREEVELLKKKQQLLAQHRTEMEKERDSLKKVLQNNGFNFLDDGTISNYQKRLKELQNWANSLKGEEKENAIAFVEDLIDVIDRYTDLVKSEIPQVIQDWEEMTTAIKDAEREQLEYVTQVQKDITSAIENELKKRTDAIKKELQKQKDLYNDQYEEEDYQDSLAKEQRTLDEIQQQINDASRDMSESGKLRLQQLKDEYLAQQEVINNMIRDREKEQGNNAFDNAMDKADEELENALDPQNIADMVNKALLDGFVTIGDEVIQLDTLMSDWLNETGDGLLAVGDLLRSELLDSLVQAGTLIGSIADNFNRIGATDVNVNTRSIPMGGNQSSPVINFNGSILTVEGDIAENMEGTLLSLIEQAKYEVMNTVQKALQAY